MSNKAKYLIGLSVTALMLFGFLVSGCGPADSPADDNGEPADDGDLSGRTVTVLGAIIDQDAERFIESVKPFEEETGITVVYEGSGDFEQLVTLRVEGGNPPDVVMFPQPGLMADLARQGQLVDLSTVMDVGNLASNYSDAWIDLGTVDDTLYGVWYRASLKSLVWYPVPAFEEAGYTIPETWDEMIALSDQMVADGVYPWAIGMESATATGWVGTDWIEDIMLRTAGPEKYDQWVTGELPFDSPEVRRAFEIAGEIFFNPDYVLGGTTSILTSPFGDAPLPLFEDPPSSYLHRQASFIAGFFPEYVQEDLESHVNAFYLPPIDAEQGRPVLGAGDVFAITNNKPEVVAFLEFLGTAEATEYWAKAGGYLSPNSSVPLDWYPDDITRVQAEILTNADVFRFDASDLMPGVVGTGSFWTEVVNWISGQDLDTTLKNIDASWPN